MSRRIYPEGIIYQVEKSIGEGLSASVFRATREDRLGISKQTVVLKILKSETDVSSLRREFEILVKANSHNCVRALAWENLPEGPALVLEWIDGVDLLELGRSCQLTQASIQSILAQTQQGLLDLFSKGFFHGDLSPANILVDRDGCVKLIDLATIDSDNSNSAKGVFGTPEYLSPERWRGEGPGASGDFFALGLIAHDLNSSFFDHPIELAESRNRAERLAVNDAGWLARSVDQRTSISIELDGTEQAELKAAVANVFASRLRMQTVGICIPKRDRSLLRLIRSSLSQKPPLQVALQPLSIALSISCLFGGWGLAQSPISPKISNNQKRETQRDGELEVRSIKWMEIKIDGHEVGYTPVLMRNLTSGVHHVTWKSALGAGETRVDIPSGQRVLLRGDGLILKLKQAPR
jgi:serine/threonine protein kinase